MNEEPKKKQEEEMAEGKLQPWTLHDYTIKSYVRSKRESEREKPSRTKGKNKREKERGA